MEFFYHRILASGGSGALCLLLFAFINSYSFNHNPTPNDLEQMPISFGNIHHSLEVVWSLHWDQTNIIGQMNTV